MSLYFEDPQAILVYEISWIWQNAINVEANLKEARRWKWGAHNKPSQRDLEVETGGLVLGPAWSRAGLVPGPAGSLVPGPGLVPGLAWSWSPVLVRGPWSLVLVPWSLVLGPWSLVPGPGPGPWSLVPGPWSVVLVPGPWSMVHGPWPMVPGPWSLAHGPWSLKVFYQKS